jgi:hypothetical protein
MPSALNGDFPRALKQIFAAIHVVFELCGLNTDLMVIEHVTEIFAAILHCGSLDTASRV